MCISHKSHASPLFSEPTTESNINNIHIKVFPLNPPFFTIIASIILLTELMKENVQEKTSHRIEELIH